MEQYTRTESRVCVCVCIVMNLRSEWSDVKGQDAVLEPSLTVVASHLSHDLRVLVIVV